MKTKTTVRSAKIKKLFQKLKRGASHLSMSWEKQINTADKLFFDHFLNAKSAGMEGFGKMATARHVLR